MHIMLGKIQSMDSETEFIRNNSITMFIKRYKGQEVVESHSHLRHEEEVYMAHILSRNFYIKTHGSHFTSDFIIL